MRYEFRKYIGTSSNYDIIENVALPFSIEDKLNEEKDEAIITIVSTEEKNRIPKNTRIEIVEIDSGLKYQFVVVKDTVTRVSMSTPYKYNHDILLIESSALLENTILPSITFSRDTGEFINISTPGEFSAISIEPNANYTLMNDIEINEINGLGNFYGTLNGNGHTVTINILNINPSINNYGLFNDVYDNSVIKNIKFIIKNESNEFVTAHTNENKSYGLLCSRNYGRIEDVEISGSRLVGSDSESIGGGNAGASIGAIAGTNYGIIHKVSVTSTRVDFTNKYKRVNIGGIVGENYGYIYNSYARTITARVYQGPSSHFYFMGGIVGNNRGLGVISRTYLYSLSKVTPSNASGYAGAITPSMSQGKMVDYSYFYSTNLNDEDSLGEPKTINDMRIEETYIGFDFETIWEMAVEPDVFPKLREIEKEIFTNPLSILSVLRRLLSISRTRFVGEDNEYELHQELVNTLQSIEFGETAEFYFNELNLWEALLEIGGKINAIPYLVDYKYINYLFLNRDSKVWTPQNNEIGYTQHQSPDAYSTNLISFGKNLVVSEDRSMGSIEYPYKDGFMTPRSISQQSIRITNDTSVFWVGMPIYDIERVLLVNVDDRQPSRKYDITRYIYTKEQYGALSDTDSGQGMALVYDQYGEYIYGLQDSPIAGFVPEYPALRNILINGLGIPSANINTDFKNIGFNIRFRTNFDNIQNTVKRSLEDFPFEADLLINQTVNQVSSSNWGEYKNYKMDKLGNVEEVRKFIFQDTSEMPKAGDRLSNEKLYVNKIVSEFYPGIVVSEISFTKNFQRISEFISVNSRKRPFRVAIDNIQDRHIRYQEFVRFSKYPTTIKNQNDFTSSHITDSFIRNIFYPLGVDKFGEMGSVSSARVQTYGVGGSKISDLIIPVSSYAQPRGLLFTTKMTNNISAGYYADREQIQGSSGYSNRSALYARNGTVDSIKFNYLYKYLDVVGTSDYIDVATQLPKNPDLPFDFESNSVLNQNTGIEIKKDNRENIFITTHIHFVNEEQDIIIGNNLTYNNLSIKDSDKYKQPRLYVLDRELEDYEFSVPTDAIEHPYNDIFVRDVVDNGNNLSGVELVVISNTPNNCESWFLSDNNGNILIGMQGRLESENSIFAFKQLNRAGFMELPLAVSVDVELPEDNPFSEFNVLIIGKNSPGKQNIIDYGDGVIERFEFDQNGVYEIEHEYISNGTINIYCESIEEILSPYSMNTIIKDVSIYNNSIKTLSFYGNYYNNIEIETISLRLMKNLEWVDFSGIDSLHSITIDDVNNLRYIDLSHTGLVDEENELLNIIDHLKDYYNEPNINATFTCIGTENGVLNYWESVMNALTAKGWNYVYN